MSEIPLGTPATEARRTPGSWVYAIDPAYAPEGAVPAEAIVGAWQMDDTGEPDAYTPNPSYRPSSIGLLLGAPGPTDPVDAALRAVATGRGTGEELLEALTRGTVYVPVGEDGQITAYEDAEGTYVSVLTDPRHGPPTTPQFMPVAAAELIRTLPAGTAVEINSGVLYLRVSSTDLLDALDARTTSAKQLAGEVEFARQEHAADGPPTVSDSKSGPTASQIPVKGSNHGRG